MQRLARSLLTGSILAGCPIILALYQTKLSLVNSSHLRCYTLQPLTKMQPELFVHHAAFLFVFYDVEMSVTYRTVKEKSSYSLGRIGRLAGLLLLFSWHISFCRLFNAKAILQEEHQWYYLTDSGEDKGDSYHFQGYLSESELKSATGVRTRLLRFRSPSLYPLHQEDTHSILLVRRTEEKQSNRSSMRHKVSLMQRHYGKQATLKAVLKIA